MMRCKEMLSVLALVVPFAVATVGTSMTSSSAVAKTLVADFCIGAGIDRGDGRGGCEYSSLDVPEFSAEVCWDGSMATVKGSAPCPSDTREFFLRYGEVIDPINAVVAAYAPLSSACKIADCEPSSYDSGQLEDEAACCDPNTGDCVALGGDDICPMGEITWCKELEQTEDGVICHQ